MSALLFRRTLAAQRGRLAIVILGLAAWGFVLPVVYATFGKDLEKLIRTGAFASMIEILGRFTGGDVFSIRGTVALGLVHPIAIALVAVHAIGLPAIAIAGERQRGTLEVLLARPLGRRRLYGTMLVVTLLFVGLDLAAVLVGIVAGALLYGVAGDLSALDLLLAWLNALALFGAFGAIALAASTAFDRLGPALGIALGALILSYALNFLGTLWPSAEWILPWTLFHYFRPTEILAGTFAPVDLVVLGGVFALAVAFALWLFPRRDLAAPS